MTNILKPNEEQDLINVYLSSNLCFRKVGEQFGVCLGTVRNTLLRHGIPFRQSYKYELDHGFFQKIDSEQKAYFLGLLESDGNVSSSSYAITLSLQEKDKHILYSFAEALRTDSPIRLSIRKPPNQNQYYIRIHSREIKRDLIRLGCIPNKTFKLEFPTLEQLPEYLIHHFIRGYFDGDGWISNHTALNSNCFGMCGRLHIMQKCAEIIGKNTNASVATVWPNKNIYYFTYSGRYQLRNIYDYLYRDATVYLHRKRERFLSNNDSLNSYELINTITQERYYTENISLFCRENRLHLSNLYKTLHGARSHHHNFKLIKVNNPIASFGVKTKESASPE